MFILLCAYNLYLDFVWSKTVVAPIRVDLLLTVPLSAGTAFAVGLWAARQPGQPAKFAAGLLFVCSVPTLTVFVWGMWNASRDAARLDSRPALIFEAEFRNPVTFANFFGNIDARDDLRAGHFQAESPRSYVSRAIVNDRGHMWLMLRCGGNVECVHWEADVGGAPLTGTLSARSIVGPPRTVVVSEWSRDRLTLALPPTPASVLVRTPVRYRETTTPQATVTFLGAFSQTRRERDYVYLVQTWLWRSGDRWLAYYTRRIAQCGSTNDFVLASPFSGKPIGDQLFFDPVGGGKPIETFRMRVPAASAARIDGEIVYNGRPLETLALERRSVLHSPIYDSAPLVDFEATVNWLSTVSMGYFMTWSVGC